MVDLTYLTVVLIIAGSLALATLITFGRFWHRHRRVRRTRLLDQELRQKIALLYAPSAAQLRCERLVVAAGLVTMGTVSWGFLEPAWLETTYQVVGSAKLRPEARIRIVHLSDLHFEADAHLAAEIISRVNALKPDLIAFTGDALNEEAGLPGFRATMSGFARIAPTYCVRGNWETWWFPNLDLYGATGAVALDGRSAAVTIRGNTLWLVGVGVDRDHEFASAIARVNGRDFTLLLHHFPALAPRAASLGVDLMLAGDTHGGQAKLPILGEIVRISRRGFWRSRGMHQEGSMQLFVNRGIGNEGGIPRFRFACRPEIAVIELRGPDQSRLGVGH